MVALLELLTAVLILDHPQPQVLEVLLDKVLQDIKSQAQAKADNITNLPRLILDLVLQVPEVLEVVILLQLEAQIAEVAVVLILLQAEALVAAVLVQEVLAVAAQEVLAAVQEAVVEVQKAAEEVVDKSRLFLYRPIKINF